MLPLPPTPQGGEETECAGGEDVHRVVIGQAGGGGEVRGCGNYMPTEHMKDPSHLQYSNSEASFGNLGNIWPMFDN